MQAMSSVPHIASLDALRAISSVLVLVGHLAGTNGCPVPHAIGKFVQRGSLGIRVSVVISGFARSTPPDASTWFGFI